MKNRTIRKRTRKEKIVWIVLLIVCIVQFIVIWLLSINSSIYQTSLEVRTVMEIESPDSEYSIVIQEEGMTYPLGHSNIILFVAHKEDNDWGTPFVIRFTIATEGAPTSENFDFEWVEEGVVIYVRAKEQRDYAYRIYWDDLKQIND